MCRRGVLGIEEEDRDAQSEETKGEKERKEKEQVEEEVRKLEEELAHLEVNEPSGTTSPKVVANGHHEEDVDEEEDG